MDAASDPETREIVGVFASQTAKTEIQLNIAGYHIARDPCPMLGVFPTDRMGTTYSKDRLAPMLRDTRCLRNLVTDRKTARKGSGSSEILEKKFPGGLYAITGANSAAGLAMRPVRIVQGDELDRWPISAGGRGGEEGDPAALAGKRVSNFPDSLQVWTSSPGVRGRSRIWAKYLQTDRNRWWCPCPHCGAEQVLSWANVDLRDGELSDEERKTLSNEQRAKRARYRCEHCGEYWDDVERWEAAAAGRWIPDAPGILERRGFWINGLCSQWLTLALLVEEWLEAQGEPFLLQVFTNTRLAELWEEGAERIEPDEILERCERYAAAVPAGVLLITAGCDVQKNRIEITRYGWGIAGECWALDHNVIHGDPAEILRATEDSRLDDLLLRARFAREDGAPMRVAASCIDSQGGFYEEVLAYCRKRRGRNVRAIRGRAGETVPLWPLRATQVKRKKLGRAELFVVGVDTAKSTLHRMLTRERPEDWKPGDPIPGFLHFPRRPEFDAEFFAQLCGEAPRPVRQRGRVHAVWVQEYPRVEACDCFVYARAAVAALRPNWARVAETRKREALKAGAAREEIEEPGGIEIFEDDDQVEDEKLATVARAVPQPTKPKPKRPAYDPRRQRRKRGFARRYSH